MGINILFSHFSLYSFDAITLEKLATDDDVIVRKIVAENKNTSIDILEKLATDKEDYVRQAVAENKNISLKILEELATDESVRVNLAVISNPKSTLSIKRRVFKNFPKYPRSPFLHFIVFMSDYAESEDLAANYNSTSWLERYAIAQNKKTPLAALKLLAKDCNRIVRATAKESLENINGS